jgi:CheY-like chemotaxis protein
MPSLIALVGDLMFLSRIREAARGCGLEVVAARDRASLVSAAAGASLVLVDADEKRLPWAEALAGLREEPALASLPVVAFVSHAHAEGIERARAAGVSRVLARSAFVQELPRLVAAAARADPTTAS